jgi:hypothetical protein
MLTYSIRLGDNDLKRDKLVWSERFVAPDLSFVSGVTSQHYHIDAEEYISASIGIDTNFTKLKVTCQNVTRNGYIIIKDKEYPIKYRKKSVASGGTFEYAEIGGVYYYITGNTITVKNWLQEEWYRVKNEDKVRVIEGDAKATVDSEANVVKLDTIIWIEDETVTIDGNTYLFDPYDGGIKYYETGRSLDPEEVTKCESIVYKHFSNISDYKDVTKFVLRKTEDESYEYDRLSYCTYFYYIFYREVYHPIRKSNDGYVCDVTLNGTTDTKTVKFRGDNVTPPARISQLKNYDAYVEIGGIEVNVQYMVQNANGGDEVAIYLSDDTHNLGVGSKLIFSYTDGLENKFPVYSISGNEFVMYENVKYMVESAITDTVLINGVEYDIEYPDGKEIGKDALVSTDDELIPMEIISGGTQLKRYGLIVSGNPVATDAISAKSAITEALYDIVTYDGVKINDSVYRVIRSADSGDSYAIIDKPVSMEFNIVSVEGSSLIICEPSLNILEYDDTFIDSMSPIFCDTFIQRLEHVNIYSKNRAFGSRIITPEIGFVNNNDADSSSTYDDILEKLTLFTNDGYIQIKLPLEMNVANNAMQEDIVTRDFYEAEKKKAINSIVDMEKDVYVPMYMDKDKLYSGSQTVFHPVTDIDINLHFRTRDLTSWKVNDGDTNAEVSGVTDNWFCTDFYPYKQILETVNDDGKTVMNSSDLMSLLFFDNDDIFYQRDNVGKSFLRFSYYDSPDPNTQSLLCTSTVFMDEHSLYKKYLDNSRRNIRDYGVIQEQKFETSATTDGTEYVVIPQVITDTSGDVINRISVATEVLKGSHDPKRKEYNVSHIDLNEMYNDTRRISSRFRITNKYNTDTSSEGFYLYMFREYSENLRPKPIYMKIEFNHAGIGKTIPFIVPMKWSGGTETDNEYFPERKLTLSGSDLEELKKGYPLSYVYAQTYIPLYAVYDYKNKQYAYVFDDRYIDRETLDKENKIRLNLFEIKIKNESTVTAEARAQVRNNNVERANINVNEKQFKDNI